ncbi:MAG: hypothetical protein LBU08_01630 [Tannerellaceae bacterium]|nr:hypothetical protein [Tannerellaceae bacterium]
MAFTLISCQQEEPAPDNKIVYGTDIYALKEYKVERHPPVVRNGFGMDIFHLGTAALDTLYLDTVLPPHHPNKPDAKGPLPIKLYTDDETLEEIEAEFAYDLLFFNEFVYGLLSTGDYSQTGFPAIFLYTDPNNETVTVKAAMVGQGVDYFEAFTKDSVAAHLADLRADPIIDLPSLRTEIHARKDDDSSIDGTFMLRESVEDFYKTLVIGNKFRPKIGGVFDSTEADAETQSLYQPVFLIRTREGLYAKFMITRFKGTGPDTQRLTLQWQALPE